MQNTMQDMTIQPKQSSLAGKQQCQPLALAAVAPGELPNQEKKTKESFKKKKNVHSAGVSKIRTTLSCVRAAVLGECDRSFQRLCPA